MGLLTKLKRLFKKDVKTNLPVLADEDTPRGLILEYTSFDQEPAEVGDRASLMVRVKNKDGYPERGVLLRFFTDTDFIYFPEPYQTTDLEGYASCTFEMIKEGKAEVMVEVIYT